MDKINMCVSVSVYVSSSSQASRVYSTKGKRKGKKQRL